MSQEFRSKSIDETRNQFLEEINQNELMSRKHKKVCKTLNYIEIFPILASAIAGCILISAIIHLFYWYSYKNYEFCNGIKNLFNSCDN